MHNSSHNKCLKAREYLMKQKQHIDIMVAQISIPAKLDYRVCLNASIECVRVSLNNAPKNYKLNASSIQKDICSTTTFLTTRVVIEDIRDDFFSSLVDEARDFVVKEQMVVGLRYVNKHGCIIERIIGIVHILETTSRILKEVVDLLFATHGLNSSRIRGQGYNGASNMSGKVNSLKS
ncbi:hypothetical protein QUC31_004372 [Theobroma cacao]